MQIMSNIFLEKVSESITCLLMVYMLNGTSSPCNIKVEESKVVGKTHFCDVTTHNKYHVLTLMSCKH